MCSDGTAGEIHCRSQLDLSRMCKQCNRALSSLKLNSPSFALHCAQTDQCNNILLNSLYTHSFASSALELNPNQLFLSCSALSAHISFESDVAALSKLTHSAHLQIPLIKPDHCFLCKQSIQTKFCKAASSALYPLALALSPSNSFCFTARSAQR